MTENPVFITPERVREIAHSVHVNADPAEAAVYFAMPEIAAAALKWAAEERDAEIKHLRARVEELEWRNRKLRGIIDNMEDLLDPNLFDQTLNRT